MSLSFADSYTDRNVLIAAVLVSVAFQVDSEFTESVNTAAAYITHMSSSEINERSAG